MHGPLSSVQKTSSNFLRPLGQAQSPHHGLQALQDLVRSITYQTHTCAPTLGPLTLLTSPLEFCFPSPPILLILTASARRPPPQEALPSSLSTSSRSFVFFKTISGTQ